MEVLERPQEEVREVNVRKRKREHAPVLEETEEEAVVQVEASETKSKLRTQQSSGVHLPSPSIDTMRTVAIKTLVGTTHAHTINMLASKMAIATVENLLQIPQTDIQRTSQLSAQSIQSLVVEVSKNITPQRVSVAEMFRNEKIIQRSLTLGCSELDTLLQGGIRTKMITEIVGEASSGKTQLCLQTALYCALPHQFGGLDGKTLYITTNEFPKSRFAQMAKLLVAKCNSLNIEVKDPLNQIYIERAPDIQTLWQLLSVRIPILLKDNSKWNVKLIIIDSIAAIIRSEYENNESLERYRSLWLFSEQLRKFSEQYNFPVIVTNQVTDKFDQKEDHFGINDDAIKQVPAMGLSWSNCINTRIMLRRTNQYYTENNETEQKDEDDDDDIEEPPTKKQKTTTLNAYQNVIREMRVIFSPFAASEKCPFIVCNEGVRGI